MPADVTPAPTAENPKVEITLEMYKALEAKLEAQNQAFARLKKKTDPEPTTEEPPATPKKTAADKELDARVAAIEAKDKRVQEAAIRQEVRSQFAALGLQDTADDTALSDATDLFLIRNGKQLQYNETQMSVLFKDSEVYDPKPLATWFSESDKAGKFKGLKPNRAAPTKGPGKGPAQAQGNGATMTRAEYKAAMIRGDQGLDKIQVLSD